MALIPNGGALLFKARNDLLDQAGNIIVTETRRLIQSRQDLLDPETIGSPTKGTTPLARKRSSGNNGPPRVDTGEMLASVKSVNAGPAIREVGVFGDREEIAIYQHFGTLRQGVRRQQLRDIKKGLRKRVTRPALPGQSGSALTHIPPRPFLGVSERAVTRIGSAAEKVQAELVQALNGVKVAPLLVRISV